MNPIINSLINSLLGRLRSIDPQNYQVITNLMNNGGNPEPFLKQIMGKMPVEQKQNILNTARNYGCPDSYLSKIQNMK